MSSSRRNTGSARDSRGSLTPHRCLLSDLYTSLQNFNNENKKSNLQKVCGTSFKEAQETLEKTLNVSPLDSSETVSGNERLPVVIQTEVKKKEQRSPSMSDLLHQSLLMGYIAPLDQVYSSQQRLAQAGIPPPILDFPYGLRDEVPLVAPTQHFRKRIQSMTFRKLLLSSVTPGRLFYEEKSVSHVSSEPGKQFLDLADLQWRYFKGLATWGKVPRMFSFMDIEFNSEKRFVGSQGMPGFIFPPLMWIAALGNPESIQEAEKHAIHFPMQYLCKDYIKMIV
ncbi:uncharacterized protein C9orf153 homolog isoform X1 [Mus musculus]|uniref:uncharacterized protein C9orf153 homolog isoform X1 n=1 Tax=Mus musculus TaxID=10090 RepID=UPI0003D70986|nr:uncharacterized protein C9orf153 homolog isoform X1 [Mus musculus]|eukprot:XP_006517438.1 PREDICTED: uncharacterized protein C9orf153 homolog isoform X1 [Mus musculus]